MLQFNDMHGKPKRNEHRIAKPGSLTSELISYTQYNYNRNGNELKNDVPVLVYDSNAQKMKKTTKMLGVETDLTIDTREKTEQTNTFTFVANLNVSMAGPIPIPIPLPYWWSGEYTNDFGSVVATKMVQKYGILMEVESFQEGALTTLRNEAFDPVTGQALITSINNEYKDKEYSVNYPAYWGYESMGPSYENIGYEDYFPSLEIVDYNAIIPDSTNNRFKVGDELFITYNQNGVPTHNNVWVMQKIFQNEIIYDSCGCLNEYYYNPNPNTGLQITNNNIIDTIPYPGVPGSFSFNHPNINNNPLPEDGMVNVYQNCGEKKTILLPRYKYSFLQNGNITNVKIKIVRSGAKNMLSESIQNYVSMETPFDANNNLKDSLNKVITISAKIFSNTNNAILPQFDSVSNPNNFDTLNDFVNGKLSVMRLFKEYVYMKNRNYSSETIRQKGLFNTTSLWRFSPQLDSCKIVDIYCMKQEKVAKATPFFCGELSYQGEDISVLHLQGYLNPPNGISNIYSYFMPNVTDPNWVVARTVTKWSPWGFELENKDATGNFTAAQYGYNHQLPIALAQNAKQHQILFEGFEDFNLLQMKNNLLALDSNSYKSSFSKSSLSNLYEIFNSTGSNGVSLKKNIAHTGQYSLETGTNGHTINFDIIDNLMDQNTKLYLPFSFTQGRKYLISFWYRPKTIPTNATTYNLPGGTFVSKSNVINGWQLFEARVTIPNSLLVTTYSFSLPKNAYIDDIRVMPDDANMKSFVYNPINQKLMATLDENNFASFFEYDQEGNLIRTKKETEKGIMTISESRSANPNTIKPGF